MNLKFEMCPTIDVDTLEELVNERFGIEITELRQLLFDYDYNNDSYKRYWFDDDVQWQPHFHYSKEDADFENLVRKYLREQCPGHKYVLIDVSW